MHETALSTWAWRSLGELLPNSDLFLFSAAHYVQVDGLGTVAGLVRSLPLKPVASRGM